LTNYQHSLVQARNFIILRINYKISYTPYHIVDISIVKIQSGYFLTNCIYV